MTSILPTLETLSRCGRARARRSSRRAAPRARARRCSARSGAGVRPIRPPPAPETGHGLAHIVCRPRPETDAGQVRGAERGRLGELGRARPARRARRPGTASASAFALAPPSTRSSRSGSPARRLDRAHGVDRLVGDRLERRARDVRAAAAAREPDDRAARVRVPVRRAESGQRRHEVHAVVASSRRASCSVSAARSMIRRPSRSHCTAAPVTKIDASSAYARAAPVAARDASRAARGGACGGVAPVLTSTNEPVPYVFLPIPGVDARLAEQRRLLVAGDRRRRGPRAPWSSVRPRDAERSRRSAARAAARARARRTARAAPDPSGPRRCRRAACATRSSRRSRARRSA